MEIKQHRLYITKELMKILHVGRGEALSIGKYIPRIKAGAGYKYLGSDILAYIELTKTVK